MNAFDKHAHSYPDLNSKDKVLKYNDFINLLTSPDFGHHDLIYLSKLSQTAIPSLDIFNFLFTISDSNNKGYINYQDFKILTQNILSSPSPQANPLTSPHADLDTHLNKLLFLLVKFYENQNTASTTLSNTPINVDKFLALVENYNPQDLPHIKSLINGEDSTLDFHSFHILIKKLPIVKFNKAYQTLQNNDTISPDQLKSIAQYIFYDKLPDSMIDHIQSFAQQNYNSSLSYDEAFNLIKLIRDLPKLNYLTCQKISNDHIETYLTSKSLYNYIHNQAEENPNLASISNDEIILYFNWNKFTYELLKSNPSINPNTLLAILTDDMVVPEEPATTLSAATKTHSSSFVQLYKSIHSFVLGSVAGMIGATIVYPIDIVKTRMQNQKGNTVYSSYLDCFKKLIRNEGFLGIYSGLLPQIIGVAPEKAIKLTLNDLVRGFAKSNSKTNEISLPWEILAGSTAGLCQVIVTNPLEVSKIRLQTQGEYINTLKAQGQIVQPKSAFQIAQSLGIRGLYKGSAACLMRDIPFSSIYFPAYANIKKYVFGLDPGKPGMKSSLEPWELLLSGGLAGMPAAFLTTPSDVIKTRIQSKARPDLKPYVGIFPTFKRIIAEEGPRALFKGGIARVCRSSPQFGFILAAYEMFQKTLPLNMFYDTAKVEKTEIVDNPVRYAGFPTAVDISTNAEKFKLSSSASVADLNPTLMSLSNYYKALKDLEKKK